MKLLIVATLLILMSCTSSPQVEPGANLNSTENEAFFDCMTRLGPNQSKGYDECAKLLG
jgi:hypothetical protein